ncbi:MAG TPA: hypothetical protein VMW75_13595 [Thermoanaerobaculia bacterium]|nr:hypothetical protein [Thermoanaerobaculia bacterium]
MLFPCAMPGALRLRTLHPLIDGDGTCSLVYDVERAAVFEVPEELKFYVAPALETGNLDEELLGWLASADLLTAEGRWDWHADAADLAAPDRPSGPWPAMAATLDGTGGGVRWGLLAAGHGNDEAHGWIDQPEAAAAIEAVDMVWKRGFGYSRIKLHLDWAGTFPTDGLLEKVVVHARRRAALSGQDVTFELVLDPEQVTVEVGRRLAAQAVRVRLRCGEIDPLARLGTNQENRPWLLAEPAVRLLLVPSREPMLTVQCMLDGPARLIELWRWAKAIGVQSLDAIRLEHPGAGDRRPGLGSPAAWIRDYRKDLSAIYEETCAELEAGGSPVEFQPLIRIVRRLMRSGAAAAMAGCHGEPDGQGDARRFAGMESCDPRLLPELMWVRLEEPAEPEAPTLPCQSCWARQVCSHSADVASALGKEDPRAPSRERCGYWSAEVEAAVRLYHRLDQIDAIQVLRFLEEAPAMEAPRLHGGPGEAAGSKPS